MIDLSWCTATECTGVGEQIAKEDAACVYTTKMNKKYLLNVVQ